MGKCFPGAAMDNWGMECFWGLYRGKLPWFPAIYRLANVITVVDYLVPWWLDCDCTCRNQISHLTWYATVEEKPRHDPLPCLLFKGVSCHRRARYVQCMEVGGGKFPEHGIPRNWLMGFVTIHSCSKGLWKMGTRRFKTRHIDGLVQDCSNSIANALQLLYSLALRHRYIH